ncbi:CHAT domain-containing protein [Nocardia bovistercoris]|uniref:CHAT domain-containing protein n=1 Tax=Nocardia bovistercoris TaxID=2785916 RepID=A0A931I7J9_9NOCA|nr:CHAT domain-containing protein [Nocardia bovistercoris]MBH0775531.1 CHAT domain-containing protein [Nocardia bovistercoris]
MEKRERLREMLSEATELYDAGLYDDAVAAFGGLAGAFDEDRGSIEYAHWCSNYGAALAETGKFKAAELLTKESITRCKLLEDDRGVAVGYFNLGNIFRYMNYLIPMSDAYEAAIEYFRKVDDREGETITRLTRASILPDSLRADELSNAAEPGRESPGIHWSLLFQRAMLALSGGDADGALELLEQARNYAKIMQDITYLRETENKILSVKMAAGYTVKSTEIDHAVDGLQVENPDRRLRSLYEFALHLRDRRDNAQAATLFESCLDLIDATRSQLEYFERFHYMEAVADISHAYSVMLIGENRFEKALEVSERGQGRALLDLMFRHQIRRHGGRKVGISGGRVFLRNVTTEAIRSYCQDSDLHILKILAHRNGVVAWFVEPDGAIDGWDAGAGQEAISELISILHWNGNEQIGHEATAETAATPLEPPPPEFLAAAAAKLYTALLPERVRSKLDTKSGRLLIIPHGGYFNIPWSLLGAPDGPLGERWDIGVSASISVALQLDRRRDVIPWRGLDGYAIPAVAFGGIPEQRISVPLIRNAENSATAAIGEIPLQFQELPATVEEADLVARATGGTLIIGRAATPDAFLAALHQAGVVHLASHGYAHPLGESFTVLAPSPTTGESVFYPTDLVFTDKIVNSELVVLAGCETGIGLPHPDSYVAMPNGFLVAGVRCVLISLWPVRDHVAAAWFESFYRHLGDGRSPASALRATNDELAGVLDPWDYGAYELVGSPFFPMATGDSAEPCDGPAFCGGDVVVSDARNNTDLDLSLYRNEIQKYNEWWLIGKFGKLERMKHR